MTMKVSDEPRLSKRSTGVPVLGSRRFAALVKSRRGSTIICLPKPYPRPSRALLSDRTDAGSVLRHRDLPAVLTSRAKPRREDSRSIDLVHWTTPHLVVTPNSDHWYQQLFWAPEIFPHEGMYYLTFNSPATGNAALPKVANTSRNRWD
jgi:hypothetical protein